MAFIKHTLILLVVLGFLEACGWVRYGRLPSPPVPSCASLSYEQQISLSRLFRNSVPVELGQGMLDTCQDQCGFVLYTGDRDPAEVKRKVGGTLAGWPVCVKAGPPVIIGVDLTRRPLVESGKAIGQGLFEQ